MLRGLSCGSAFHICQDLLKSANVLHKWGFVDSQMSSTVRAENQLVLLVLSAEKHCCCCVESNPNIVFSFKILKKNKIFLVFRLFI